MQEIGSPEMPVAGSEGGAESGVALRQIRHEDLVYLCWAAEEWCLEHDQSHEFRRPPVIGALNRAWGVEYLADDGKLLASEYDVKRAPTPDQEPAE